MGEKYALYACCFPKNRYFWPVEYNSYLTIAASVEAKFVERKSTFLSFALPVDSWEACEEHLRRFRKDYYDARHVCYAWVGLSEGQELTKSSDNGEPSGTAGRPMLGCLLSHELKNVLVVVIRYFGGIKLGVPGLIAAYKAATEEVLQKASVVRHTIEHLCLLTFPYERMNDVMQILKRYNIRVLENMADIECHLRVGIPQEVFSTVHPLLIKVASLQSAHGSD